MGDPRNVTCPCCRFPTLRGVGTYEICPICWWEDDGQNDQNADKARRGPNSRFSLTDARRNFADHHHMYDLGDEIPAVEQPSAARLELMNYLRSIGFNPHRTDVKQLWKLLDNLDQ